MKYEKQPENNLASLPVTQSDPFERQMSQEVELSRRQGLEFNLHIDGAKMCFWRHNSEYTALKWK